MTDNGIKPCVILLTLYGPLYSNTVIGRPTLGGLLHGTAKRGQGGGCVPAGPAPFPPRCTKCNSPPINGQYINFINIIRTIFALTRLKG